MIENGVRWYIKPKKRLIASFKCDYLAKIVHSNGRQSDLKTQTIAVYESEHLVS